MNGLCKRNRITSLRQIYVIAVTTKHQLCLHVSLSEYSVTKVLGQRMQLASQVEDTCLIIPLPPTILSPSIFWIRFVCTK